MTKNEIEDIAEILRGYESWKKAKVHAFENGPDYQLSVSAYLDDYAKQRAVDVVDQIRNIYMDPYLTRTEIAERIGELLGIEDERDA